MEEENEREERSRQYLTTEIDALYIFTPWQSRRGRRRLPTPILDSLLLSLSICPSCFKTLAKRVTFIRFPCFLSL